MPGDPAADDALVAELVRALGAERVRVGALERTLFDHDASGTRGDRPAVVCLPHSTAEVAACVKAARRHGRPFVARGSGTGLSGGAVPISPTGAPPVVITTAHLDAVRDLDPVSRTAWVQPGVLNLDLSKRTAHLGLHFAPDPSSQQASSIGGNVSTNAGGPHCLAEGVTQSHVLALEVVLPDGEIVVLGGTDPEPLGYDLRGVVVGGEGTLGVVTGVLVRLTPNPPAVRTLLLDFADVRDGAACVSAIIAAGLVPAAIEMMDARITAAVEAFVHAGFPLDAAAILIVEVDGLPHAVDAAVDAVVRIGTEHRARTVRVAADADERALWWKGRKGAFGALARIKPDYYLHDTVVPRARLVEVLESIDAICEREGVIVVNVFHAGDGNLHPIMVFDRREPGMLERVHRAGEEIVKVSVAAGGVLSGEHGIGLEKRDLMGLVFSECDLEVQRWVREAFDPDVVANPCKVLPTAHSCGDVAHLGRLPEGTWL